MKKLSLKQIRHLTDFDAFLEKELKNPEFKKAFDEEGKKLEVAYALLQLRKKEKMSQVALARKLRTKQSNVARWESGQENITIETLHRVARVFKRELKVEFVKSGR